MKSYYFPLILLFGIFSSTYVFGLGKPLNEVQDVKLQRIIIYYNEKLQAIVSRSGDVNYYERDGKVWTFHNSRLQNDLAQLDADLTNFHLLKKHGQVKDAVKARKSRDSALIFEDIFIEYSVGSKLYKSRFSYTYYGGFTKRNTLTFKSDSNWYHYAATRLFRYVTPSNMGYHYWVPPEILKECYSSDSNLTEILDGGEIVGGDGN